MEANHSLAVLVPDEYDEYNYEEFSKKNFLHIFEEESDAWMSDPDVWPRNRTYKKFNEWFRVLVSDAVIDLGTGPVKHELF